MKLVADVIGILQLLQVYRLSNRVSTAIIADAAFMDINPGETNKSEFHHQNPNFSLHLDLYSELCTIEVDLSHLWKTSNVRTMSSGSGVYYRLYYDLVMLFGGTEIQAQLCWMENVCSIIYENCLLC